MAKTKAAPKTEAKPEGSIDIPDASSELPGYTTSRGPEISVGDRVNDFLQGPQADVGEEMIGTAATPEMIQAFRNRISGQTQVPQADPNTTFESRGAQIASTSEPTQPRVEVRQQPSSGVQVTDLSNVAATEGGMPAKETNPELSAIRQQLEMYEGSPTQSPFQAGGAMEELRRQSMDVKRSSNVLLIWVYRKHP